MRREGSTKALAKRGIAAFFSTPARLQSYLNLLYILLSAPLGLFYFSFLTVGLSLGFSLLLVWIGIPILLFMMAARYAFIYLERRLALFLLRIRLPPLLQQRKPHGWWPRIKMFVNNPFTWKGILFLLLKLPVGLLAVGLIGALLTEAVALIAPPFAFALHPTRLTAQEGVALALALLGAGGGILLVLLSLHVANAAAWLSGRLAFLLLTAEGMTGGWWKRMAGEGLGRRSRAEKPKKL